MASQSNEAARRRPRKSMVSQIRRLPAANAAAAPRTTAADPSPRAERAGTATGGFLDRRGIAQPVQAGRALLLTLRAGCQHRHSDHERSGRQSECEFPHETLLLDFAKKIESGRNVQRERRASYRPPDGLGRDARADSVIRGWRVFHLTFTP